MVNTGRIHVVEPSRFPARTVCGQIIVGRVRQPFGRGTPTNCPKCIAKIRKRICEMESVMFNLKDDAPQIAEIVRQVMGYKNDP